MSRRKLVHVISAVVLASGIAMLAPVVVALLYRDWSDAIAIALAASITITIGWVGRASTPQPDGLTPREGFATVGLAWMTITGFGTLPYFFTGSISNIADAIFETTAGFTTTGASIFPRPEQLPEAILFWRALTQWLGGMGIIVLSIAILPFLGIGGVSLAAAEAPGPTPDRLTPRFSETAKRLWYVYVGITVLQVIFLVPGDMGLVESVALALTTLSTGGFSTTSASLGGFSAYSQWVVIVFMFVAGVSFALHYRALRAPGVYMRSVEFKLYTGVIVAATVLVIGGTWGGDITDTVRNALFTVVSIVSTTGYGTADFELWVPSLQILILGLMFVGGMAGSTAGSVTPYRLAVLFQASRVDARKVIHPRGVFITRLGKDKIPEAVVQSTQAFFLLYMFTFMTATLIMGLIEGLFGEGLGVITSASAVASAIGNVGPGLSAVGPTDNYSVVHDLTKVLLAFVMLVGRLEIFPIILLFTPELWKR